MSVAFKTAFNGTISPSVQVNGQTVTSMSKGFGTFQAMAEKIMSQFGLADIKPDGWYPAKAWLDAFRQIQEKVGNKTLYQIGMKIPESAQFPPQINSAQAALAGIDMAYHMNHKGGEIGIYGYSATGDKSADIFCQNPYPCSFDEGIITAMARRFEPRAQVTHDPAGCREKGGKSCLFHVSW
jgi:hypothetical protein